MLLLLCWKEQLELTIINDPQSRVGTLLLLSGLAGVSFRYLTTFFYIPSQASHDRFV